jgi:flagellar FliL protein
MLSASDAAFACRSQTGARPDCLRMLSSIAYLRVKVTLEVQDQKTIEALKPVMPRVLDTFQVHLRELRAGDLEGSAGLFRLREELTRRVNHAIAPAKIRAVLFREVVVQ